MNTLYEPLLLNFSMGCPIWLPVSESTFSHQGSICLCMPCALDGMEQLRRPCWPEWKGAQLGAGNKVVFSGSKAGSHQEVLKPPGMWMRASCVWWVTELPLEILSLSSRHDHEQILFTVARMTWVSRCKAGMVVRNCSAFVVLKESAAV